MINQAILFAYVVALSQFLATSVAAQNFDALRAQVLALGELTDAPATYPADGFQSDGDVAAIYFDALPFNGKPTRVFAWMGVPSSASQKVSGVVLVHGGGGTAFKDWVQKWNEKGFAAISIAVEGQTDVRIADPTSKGWERHEFGGPARKGIYGDSDQPLADQWMYHAVADTVLANSLLRSHPNVDADKVGMMGISWGGIITSTVIGIDNRLAFAIPTYGCGDLADVPNQYGRALGENMLYRNVWDPMVRMANAKMPTLWLSWTGDVHFPLDSLSHCYRAVTGPHMVAILPNMRHSHQAGWNPPDSYAFADSVIQDGKVWCEQTGLVVKDGEAHVRFRTTKPIESAVLITTADSGMTNSRRWSDHDVVVRDRGDGVVIAEASLPRGTTAWFVNLRSGDLVASSDYQQPNQSDSAR